MAGSLRRALVLNAGSSSLKYALFEVRSRLDTVVRCSGLAERLGSREAQLTHECADGSKNTTKQEIPSMGDAVESVVRNITSELHGESVHVVGHRVVHGGEHFSTPAIVNDDVEAAIESVVPLAPLHNPSNLLCIREARKSFSSAPHVAVFDTAFHATMPPEAYRYALPDAIYREHGVRKYGFHGSSYNFVVDAVATELKKPKAELNAIVMHLGNGASVACIKGGVSIDTSMGMTPLEGLVMGTRCGDVDPAVFSFLCALGHSPSDVDTILNKKSGLLGLFGKNDMRAIRQAADGGDETAALARQLFIKRIRKYLGAYLVNLHGEVDAIVFTAGIGEHDHDLRRRVCAGLGKFGIEIDDEKNAGCSELRQVQPSGHAGPAVMVVPTNEELSIALQAIDVTQTR